eukprot:SAG11_NODE_640_length_8012_cov_14.412486_2_plen_42_part_00
MSQRAVFLSLCDISLYPYYLSRILLGYHPWFSMIVRVNESA